MAGSMVPGSPGVGVPVSDADKTDIRRFCGYEFYGAGNAGFQSWRTFDTTYGKLEYRLQNLSASEYAVVQQKLTELRGLESALITASAGLDVAQAAVYTRNPNEMAERNRLYREWRLTLCAFIGVPPGDGLSPSNAMRLVV